MTEPRRYRSVVADNARWTGFRFRAGDIVISTPPKSGTTWMQLLCAMLVFDAVEFDRPLTELSPWLDMQIHPLADVLAALEAQTHRRFIKTHTPLDGLPFDPRVTYLCVGRDPRDVAVSFEHHMANLDMAAFMTVRARAVGLADLAELGPPPAPASEDPLERFRRWLEAEPAATMAPTLGGILHHLATFWDRRNEPNLALFHYGDLLADLPGQLRRLRDVLAIERPDARLEEFAAAATFERMRQRADALAPEVDVHLWRDPRAFFHRGRSGQWRELLDAQDLRRY